MSHIVPVTPQASKPSISTTFFTRKTSNFISPRFHKFYACATTDSDQKTHVQRRNVALGLAGVVWGLSSIGGGNAWGAAKRPPPPPPKEKKDPNVTGLAAKLLASKKRKEAMNETISRLRDQGKAIQETSK